MKTPKLFATEADLCAAFLASIDSAKWIDKIHPRVYNEIAADFAKWAPPVPNLKQTALL